MNVKGLRLWRGGGGGKLMQMLQELLSTARTQTGLLRVWKKYARTRAANAGRIGRFYVDKP